jgi:starch phosphorylase
MGILIGRSRANNIMNLMLHPFIERAVRESSLDWFGLVEQEPDAGLGNGGLGRLAACFLDSMATMQLPAMGYGLRYEYGMFRQSIDSGWQREHPDSWLRRQDPWEVSRRSRGRRDQAGLHLRDPSGQPGDRRQSSFDPDRHPLRPARDRLRRQDDQQPAAVERCGDGFLRLPGIQLG